MAIIADTPDLNFPIATTPLGGLDGQAQHYSEKERDTKIKAEICGMSRGA
jgi:hypothetical protein